MKSRIFFLLTISVLLVAAAHRAVACGPFFPIIPTPEFFKTDAYTDFDREENLRLWQSVTYKEMELNDIEAAVYSSTLNDWNNYVEGKNSHCDNQFFAYLNDNGDDEITDFMLVAKTIEEKWATAKSPWYFPQERNAQSATGDYSAEIARCKAYDGERLKDRYAFQVVRAMYASRAYSECINYYDSAFADIPDSNLLKRMATQYVAGCWSRFGMEGRADTLFARCGAVSAIEADDRVALTASLNPDAPQIMEYIRRFCTDSAQLAEVVPVAQKMIRRKSTADQGDWLYLLAYYYGEYCNDPRQADGYMQQALEQNFSNDEIADFARAYKMKLDAHSGCTLSLVNDLQWIEDKCTADPDSPDSKEWVRRLRNIIYADWVPELWEKGDYATAISLCAYADRMAPEPIAMYPDQYDTWSILDLLRLILPGHLLPADYRYYNTVDYGGLAFQMMGSLTSSELADAHSRMMKSTPLSDFLSERIRTDTDYYYELIGTLALREGNYSRAVLYLSDVSPDYQSTVNVYRRGYLRRDPFAIYPSRWKCDEQWDYEWEASAGAKPTQPAENAKLTFARRMSDYQKEMQSGKTADDRGIARLMYAIGQFNSFEECWALTQYWRGFVSTQFYPDLQYYGDDFAKRKYAFLYNYETTVGHKHTKAIYDREVKAALAMLTTDEARAQAQYILGNLKTIVKRYPDTKVAQYVKTSCDRWQDWI